MTDKRQDRPGREDQPARNPDARSERAKLLARQAEKAVQALRAAREPQD